VPLEVFEDSDDLAAWAQKAFLTAIRARKQPAEKRKKPETRPESGKTRRKPAAS
jgi:hypothetical protein